jgi:phosphate:Na+ symporter
MIDTGNSYFIIMLGGVALFLYGMTVASNALEKLMANRISNLMSRMAQHRLTAIVVGISLTTLLQSSGAVTSMLVSLGTAGVVTLKQVMGVIIGTAIGSTLTVQLISLDIAQYSLPLFSVAFFFYFQTKKNPLKNFCLVVMGFALLFLGLKMISISSHHFVDNPILQEFFQSLRDNPFYSFLVSMIFCGLIHSSAATIGVAMSLASVNAISVFDAMIWVYGANVGTTFTAILAAMGSNYVGRQVAWAHFFYKILSVAIFYFLTNPFIAVLSTLDSSAARIIANGHLVFNLLSAIIFYPFIEVGANLIEKMIPQSSQEKFGAEFLGQNNYQSSALAISYANREIMRLADMVLGMITDSIRLFELADTTLLESIKERDNKVDFLYRETKMFLLDHVNKSGQQVQQSIMNMIMFLSDLERAADAIDINIVALAIKKYALKLEFSPEDWEEVTIMHGHVIKVASMAVNAYQTKELSDEAIKLKRELTKIEISFRENHISRLNRGIRDSINTSSIHLDLLSEYRRIVSLLCNHAYTEDKGKMQ